MKKNLLLLLAILFVMLQKTNVQTPAAYYPLNGNANDARGNNLNGMLAVVLRPVAQRLENPGNALNFNGSTRIEVADKILLGQQMLHFQLEYIFPVIRVQKVLQ